MESELTLSLGGLPPLSSRGCYQELTPVIQGVWKRTLNGCLVYIGPKDIKYKTLITCKDKTVLATEEFALGQVLEVGCIQRIWQKIASNYGDNNIVLNKDFVDGSLCLINESQEMKKIENIEGRKISFKFSGQNLFLSYRPKLQMMVKNFKIHVDEWGMMGGWNLEMEEV